MPSELNTLIMENQNLIYAIAHNFGNPTMLEDLFQVGCIGLMNAYKNYDPTYQVKFSTYAYPYIVGEMKKLIREKRPGSMIVGNTQFAGNEDGQVHTTLSRLNEIQEFAVREIGVPMLFGKDVIHGHKTVYPIPLAMAASFNEDFIKQAYEYTKLEAANDGLHWAFTPMLDVSHDPRWGRIIESPGEDPYIGERFAAAVVRGLQGNNLSDKGNMLACAKHYIAYSLAEGGRDYHRAEVSDYNLRNYYLKPFRVAVKAGVKTVMSSFNEVSGQPVTSSRYLLTDVLRGELGFEGFVHV